MKKLLLPAMLTAIAGCAAPTVRIEPVYEPPAKIERRISEAPGIARVQVLVPSRYVIEMKVTSIGDKFLLINREGFVLVTAKGERRNRLEGGAGTMYKVSPNGSHAVNVRYSYDGIPPGDAVSIDLAHAVYIEPDRQPVQLEPLIFVLP